MEKIKTSSQSWTIQENVVQPDIIKVNSEAHGGNLTYIADTVAGICFARHNEQGGVTAAVDNFNYIRSIPMGNLFTAQACITGTGKRSAEVFVMITGEDLVKQEKYLAATAFYTYVSTSPQGQEVPQIKADSDLAERLMAGYPERRQARLQARHAQKEFEAFLNQYLT